VLRSSIISDLDAADMTVVPAPGVDIDHGLARIKTLLSWKSDKPRDSINSPKLFVSNRCKNVIYALKEYSAYSLQENCKDPIDCLRMFATSNIQFYSKADMRGGGRSTEDDLG
jgi:hypothetical protein